MASPSPRLSSGAPSPDDVPPAAPPRKTSTLKKIVYVIILLVAISILLQVLGFGIYDRREDNVLIEQPHLE